MLIDLLKCRVATNLFEKKKKSAKHNKTKQNKMRYACICNTTNKRPLSKITAKHSCKSVKNSSPVEKWAKYLTLHQR